MTSADLEHPSLLPAMLLGDAQDGEGLGRSTRDWIVDITAFLIALLGGAALLAVATESEDPAEWLIVVDFLAGIAACLGLWLRRRWPVGLALAIAPLTLFSAMSGMASAIALFTVAVHRPAKVVLSLAAVYLVAVPIYYTLRPSDDGILVGIVFGVLVTVALIAWGMFVRARRQLVLSLRERAQRAESEQALRIEQARSAERERIAREMHDVLAHRISLVSLHAGALEYAQGSTPAEVGRAAGVIRAAAHQALEDLREVIGVLRDGAMSGAPPRPQPTLADLDSLLAESRAAGMRVRSEDGAMNGDVPTSIGRGAYRVVQEGLTNARKHAPGCSVDVAVSGAAGEGLTVEVRNPLPVGRTMPGIPGAGTGIIGLTERVELAGGRLEHGLSDGEWRLLAWLPWPAA